MQDVNQMIKIVCSTCNKEVSTCPMCKHVFTNYEFFMCMDVGEQRYHFCNEDCAYPFIRMNMLFEAHPK